MARWAMEAVRAHASVCKFKGLVRDLIAAIAQNRCLARLGAGWRHDALLAETPCAGDPRVFPDGGYCAGGGGVRAVWQKPLKTLAQLQRNTATTDGSRWQSGRPASSGEQAGERLAVARGDAVAVRCRPCRPAARHRARPRRSRRCRRRTASGRGWRRRDDRRCRG